MSFTATEWPGVYQSDSIFVSRVKIVLLNELESTAHNTALKCFATRRREREKVLATTDSGGFMGLSDQIKELISGLLGVMNMPKTAQTDELTPEMVMAMGKKWIDAMLNVTPLDEILNRHKPDEVLNHYKANEVLSHFNANEVLNHYKPEQRLAGLTEEQIRAYLAKLQH